MSNIIAPGDDATSIHDWWNRHHQNEGDFRLWLTGSQPLDVWLPLEVDARVRRGATVLNIGVGLGDDTRALVKRGCTVHALDISPAALAKVAPVVAKTWLAADLPSLPERTFDLAISHLVAQHMSDEALDAQLRAVIRALRPDGVFALQFAYSLDPSHNDLPQATPELIKVGGVCRSLGHLAQMVTRAGGMVVWAQRLSVYPQYGSGWYAVHITRPEFTPARSFPALHSARELLHAGARYGLRKLAAARSRSRSSKS